MAKATETVREWVERVLIVLKPNGELQGAIQESLRETTRDGVVRSEALGVVALDAKTLDGILDPNTAALVAQVQQLKEELAKLTLELGAANMELAKLKANQ